MPTAAQDVPEPTATPTPLVQSALATEECAQIGGLTVCVDLSRPLVEDPCFQIAGGRTFNESMITEHNRLVQLEDGSERKIKPIYVNRCDDEPLAFEDWLWLGRWETIEDWQDTWDIPTEWVSPRFALNARVCPPFLPDEPLSACDVYTQFTSKDALFVIEVLLGEVVNDVPQNWFAVLNADDDGIWRVLWIAGWLTERVADETGAPFPTATPYVIDPEKLYDFPDSREALNRIARTVASVPPCTQLQAATFVGSEYREYLDNLRGTHMSVLPSLVDRLPEEKRVDFAHGYISEIAIGTGEILQEILDSAVACQEVVNCVALTFLAVQAVQFEDLVNEEYDSLPALVRAADSIERLERVSGIYMR